MLSLFKYVEDNVVSTAVREAVLDETQVQTSDSDLVHALKQALQQKEEKMLELMVQLESYERNMHDLQRANDQTTSRGTSRKLPEGEAQGVAKPAAHVEEEAEEYEQEGDRSVVRQEDSGHSNAALGVATARIARLQAELDDATFEAQAALGWQKKCEQAELELASAKAAWAKRGGEDCLSPTAGGMEDLSIELDAQRETIRRQQEQLERLRKEAEERETRGRLEEKESRPVATDGPDETAAGDEQGSLGDGEGDEGDKGEGGDGQSAKLQQVIVGLRAELEQKTVDHKALAKKARLRMSQAKKIILSREATIKALEATVSQMTREKQATSKELAGDEVENEKTKEGEEEEGQDTSEHLRAKITALEARVAKQATLNDKRLTLARKVLNAREQKIATLQAQILKLKAVPAAE